MEKVRPGTWTGSEEGVEGKRSRMWTHEDGKRWTHEDGKMLTHEDGRRWTHEDELDREMGEELTQPLSVPT